MTAGDWAYGLGEVWGFLDGLWIGSLIVCGVWLLGRAISGRLFS